jgi:ABC-type polysaccharide transport system permease subunit
MAVKGKTKIRRIVGGNAELYLLLLLPLIWLTVFKYGPMYGIQIAFKNFRAVDGIWGSSWVGLKNFQKFFNNYMFVRTLRTPCSSASINCWFPFRSRSSWRSR